MAALQPRAAYGGRCLTCGGAHALRPDAAALAAAREVDAAIRRHERLDWEAPGPGDPRFGIEYLDGSKGPGRMLGVLIARDPARGAEPRVLRAFSGQITERWGVPGWVGPVQSLASGTRHYDAVRRVTEGLSARIAALKALQQREAEVAAAAGGGGAAAYGDPAGPRQAAGGEGRGKQRRRGTPRRPGADRRPASSAQRFVSSQLQLLTARRTRVSHELLERVQRSYHTSDFAGQELSLLEVYRRYSSEVEPLPLTRAGAFLGFPAGCGDCAAPKLLHAAARNGWRPLALVEWFFGAPPGTATLAKPARRVRLGGGRGDSRIANSSSSSDSSDAGSGGDNSGGEAGIWDGGGDGALPAGEWVAAPAPDAPVNATRQHGRVYGQCPKCSAILGTMLHGLDG